MIMILIISLILSSQQSTQQFFSAMSDLYHYYELYSTRKYVEVGSMLHDHSFIHRTFQMG